MTPECQQSLPFCTCYTVMKFTPAGHPLCLYGDPAYPLRVHLQGPFKGAIITPQMQAFNSAMSIVRISVEWLFRDLLQDYLDLHSRTTLFNSSTQIIGQVFKQHMPLIKTLFFWISYKEMQVFFFFFGTKLSLVLHSILKLVLSIMLLHISIIVSAITKLLSFYSSQIAFV